VKALETNIIPPTINYETPDPECDLNYTANKAVKVADLRVAISDNLGFGGHNGVIAFRKIQ
jgi:3-oxoacyl-[acyl-carrier-protein] synthase II